MLQARAESSVNICQLYSTRIGKPIEVLEIQSVGIASISYDEESTKLINMRNQGAMLGDPSIREGYVQGAVARGIEAAGSNANGSMAGFMGVGMGMNSTGSFMNAASASNTRQMEQMREENAANANNTAKPGMANGNSIRHAGFCCVICIGCIFLSHLFHLSCIGGRCRIHKAAC